MSKPVFEDNFRFSGRRNRKSFFLFTLAIAMMFAVLAFVFGFVAASNNETAIGAALLVLVVPALAIAVASWAVAAQRCRDFGWTGWAALIALVPFVGWLFSLAIYFVPGDVGENRYGPSPIG